MRAASFAVGFALLAFAPFEIARAADSGSPPVVPAPVVAPSSSSAPSRSAPSRAPSASSAPPASTSAPVTAPPVQGAPVASSISISTDSSGESVDYDKSRIEPAVFPIIGGSSDIGFEFGAVGTFSKFGNSIRPYEWNLDLVAAVSFKGGPSGAAELTQQNFLMNLDVPGLRHGTLRINPEVAYIRTVNEGYFGLGNATTGKRPAVINGEAGQYFEYEDRYALVRELTRVRLHPPFDLMIATTYRYEAPESYAGSQLAQDRAAGKVLGLSPMSLGLLGAGVIYDSRDNEYFPHKGAYNQIGVRYVQGVPFSGDVHYGAFGAILAIYRPIGGPFVLAARALVDAEVGNVPFYDLLAGEPFNQDQIIGGSAGVRGVPEGRYLGKLKALGNLELRAMLIHIHLLGQAFHIGGDLLFDTGRVWSDYTFNNPEDGSGLGLKWGAGGGLYFIWGQAAVFRVEAAYSPDAASENPSFPIGLYVQDNVAF
jgi:hypothetical protein